MNQPRNLQQEIDFLKGRFDLLELILIARLGTEMPPGFAEVPISGLKEKGPNALSVVDDDLNPLSVNTLGRSDSYRAGVDNEILRIQRFLKAGEKIMKKLKSP